jgi:hypothetical protein
LSSLSWTLSLSLHFTSLSLSLSHSHSPLSPELYVTFWALSLYDIHYPKATYEAEIQRKRAEITAVGQIGGAAAALGAAEADSAVRYTRRYLSRRSLTSEWWWWW